MEQTRERETGQNMERETEHGLPQGHEVEAEIFSVGRWNGESFSRAHLEEIVRNFETLKHRLKPPLKFGHDEGQTLLGQRDGDPALGWVERLRVEGDKLLATFSGVPALVYQAIRAGRYRRVSAELYFNVRRGRRRLGRALKAVALLGADLPAVTNLADLGAYLATREPGQERLGEARAYALPVWQTHIMNTHEEEPPMREEEAQGDLQAELAELRAYKERQENVQVQERQRRQREAFASVRRDALAFCDAQVQAGRLTPHLRQQLAREIDRQAHRFAEGGALQVSFDWVRSFMEQAGPLLPGDESAHARQEALADPPGNPSVALARQAVNKMTELNLTYSAASEYVLRTQPALARAYREYTLQPHS
jgi:hypothetical protein